MIVSFLSDYSKDESEGSGRKKKKGRREGVRGGGVKGVEWRREVLCFEMSMYECASYDPLYSLTTESILMN